MKLTTEMLKILIQEELAQEGIMDMIRGKNTDDNLPRDPKSAAADSLMTQSAYFDRHIVPAINATQGSSTQAVEKKERLLEILPEFQKLLKELAYYSIS
jgi:hypothetical protein